MDVWLREWSIGTLPTMVSAGQVYFLATNEGLDDAHELVIIRTDLEITRLPLENHKVPEKKVEMIGEIEPFAARSQAGCAFNLAAGNYVLICNITETEDGEVESQLRERHAHAVHRALNKPRPNYSRFRGAPGRLQEWKTGGKGPESQRASSIERRWPEAQPQGHVRSGKHGSSGPSVPLTTAVAAFSPGLMPDLMRLTRI